MFDLLPEAASAAISRLAVVCKNTQKTPKDAKSNTYGNTISKQSTRVTDRQTDEIAMVYTHYSIYAVAHKNVAEVIFRLLNLLIYSAESMPSK